MSCKNAARLKAVEQARAKLKELTTKDVVSFTFLLTEEGPEMIGEEELVTELMGVLEEKQIIELAQRIKMRGQALTHRSTRSTKIQQMQEAFGTQLPPTLLPLGEMVDYDLLRSLFNELMKVEGMGTLWQPGEEPPQSVRDWWGEEDFDLFRLYKNQNLTKEMMELVRGRYRQYQRNSLFYFKEKITSCYRLRVGEQNVNKYNMRLPKAKIEEINQARLQRVHQKQDEREQEAAAAERQQREAEIEAAVERRVQREVDERVAREVQARVRERTRQTAVDKSPERRRRPNLPGEGAEHQGDEGGSEQGDGDDELKRRFAALRDMVEDPDSSVLIDPAAVAVLRAPTPRAAGSSTPGPSRTTRQLYKCPYAGKKIQKQGGGGG